MTIKLTKTDLQHMPFIKRIHSEVSTVPALKGKIVNAYLIKHDKWFTVSVYEQLPDGELEFWGEEWFHSIAEAIAWPGNELYGWKE